MPDYGLKYTISFDGGPDGAEPYSTELLFKDYVGADSAIVGSGQPVQHPWPKDEPKAGVKGSQLDMAPINFGTLPLSDFFSNTDDNCMVIHKWGSQVLFVGFLVQDDCKEIMVDYNHVIALSATDNLGLLKDVSLLEASQLWGSHTTYNTTITRAADYYFIFQLGITTFTVAQGDSIEILITDPDGVPYNGLYLVLSVEELSGSIVQVEVASLIPLPLGFGSDYDGDVTLKKPFDLTGRPSFAQIIRLCLLSTNLELNCNVYANIIEAVTTTPRFLEETFEGGQDYSTGNNQWKSCYDVLTIIMERFNATLFQAEGVWNIIRWDELRLYNNAIPGWRYDMDMLYVSGVLVATDDPAVIFTAPNDMELVSTTLTPVAGQLLVLTNAGPYDGLYHIVAVDNTTPGSPILTFSETVATGAVSSVIVRLFSDVSLVYDDIFTAGLNEVTYPVSAPLKSILGAYKFAMETFNYKQPANLLCNYNLQKIGPLLNTYASGPNTVNEYEMTCWSDGPFAPFPDRYIRVTIDALGNEILRYAVLTGATGSNVLSAMSEPIDAEIGDTVKVSFQWRTAVSHTSVNNAFAVRLTDGTTTNYIQADGSWDTPIGVNLPFDDSGVWNPVDIPLSKPVPFRGQINVFLNDATYVGGEENWYKDLSFEYTPAVNEMLKIIGHTHTDSQSPIIKANEDEEIFIDDSPRNSINGCLFLSTFTGVLQDRTTLWGYAPAGTRRLGEITTFETLFWRRIARTKIEGTFKGLVQTIPVTTAYTLNGSTGQVDIPSGLFEVISAGLPVGIFIPGAVFVLSGTASNDGTYTVAAIIDSSTFTVLEAMSGFEAGTFTLSIATTMRRHVSMLTTLRYTGLAGLNFIFGMLSIDYKRNSFNVTLWEQWKDSEVDSYLRQYYQFKYLYETK